MNRWRWKQAWERLWPGPRALVLAYHRITTLPTDPYGLCTGVELFRRHLEVIRAHGQVRVLSELAGMRGPGVALSFDDGYADNLTNAAPLLREFGIPATFFVTTRALTGEGEFWWDELDALLLQEEVSRHRDWRLWRDRPPTCATRMLRSLYRCFEKLPVDQQAGLLARLRELFPGPRPARPSHRRLSQAELCQLAAQPGLEVGCHTVSHERLSLVGLARQRAEIGGARRELEGLLERPVAGFAYPYGAYARQTPSLVREAGFAYACTFRPGVVRPTSDPYRLPRWPADGLDPADLAALLRGL